MGGQSLEEDFQGTYVFAVLPSEISFAWHLMQTWVLCWVHTLSEKDEDLQDEILKELTHICTYYQDN